MEEKSRNVRASKKRVRKLAVKWSSEQTLKLIKEVEMREGTWNSLSRKYRDRSLRKALWQEVADKMELPRSEVATKWNSLRCSFRAAFNKMAQTKRGQGAGEALSPNPLFTSLKFLEPMLQNRAPTTPNCLGNGAPSTSHADLSDLEDNFTSEEQPSPSTSTAKRRRVEKNYDDGYREVIERALETMAAATANDIWDDVGNFVASNGRDWAKENLQLANEFKADVYELVCMYQKKLIQLGAKPE